MYQTIEFNDEMTVDLEVLSRKPLEPLHVRKGTRRRVQVKPYVAETPQNPIELADQFFDEGTSACSVPFERFRSFD